MYLYLFVLGAAVGSFLNVVSDRLPQDKSLNGRSHCEFCKKTLAWYDLIPVVSFLMIKGRCRYCHKKLSWWYWVAEVTTGLAFVETYLLIHNSVLLNSIQHLFEKIGILNQVQDDKLYFLSFIYSLLIISTLIAILFSDLKHHIIPDQLTIVFTILTIPFILIHPLDSLYGALSLVVVIGGLWFFTKGKGMGFGDVKFAVPMGLLLGFQNGLIGLYLAFMIGGIVGIIALIGGFKKMKSHIAFGPFLIMGICTMLFFKAYVFQFIHLVFHL